MWGIGWNRCKDKRGSKVLVDPGSDVSVMGDGMDEVVVRGRVAVMVML